MESATNICSLPGVMDGSAGMAERPTEARAAGRIAGNSPLARWADYLELLKPRMNLLVVGTTMVGFSMATHRLRDWLMAPHVLIGTAICAAGAAVLNQWAERSYDALMARTARRPLPAGRIAAKHALILGLVAAVVGPLYLLLTVNGLTALLGATTLLGYVLIYTPLKRVTTLNTIVGAVAGAIPPMMGWTALTGSIAPTAIGLFAILMVWQIPHFLAIAILYREDYRNGGFRMLPVNDPAMASTGRQILLYSAALLPVSLAPAVAGAVGQLYVVWALALGLVFLAYAIACATRPDRPRARKLFFASIIYLPTLLAMMMLDRN